MQCEHLVGIFPHMDKITHILCSPLKRTLDTTIYGFYPLLSGHKGLSVIAWPALREYGTYPCNHGAPLETLRTELAELDELNFLTKPFDLSLVSEEWEIHRESLSERPGRAARVRRELHALGVVAKRRTGGIWNGITIQGNPDGRDVEILVISHGGFLQGLTGHTGEFCLHWVDEW